MGQILNGAEKQKLLWSGKINIHICLVYRSYAKMYISTFTDICIRKDRLHSIGWNSNLFSIFLFRNSRAQSYHSPVIRKNTRKSEIYRYNRQHNHQSAYSQWASLAHFSFFCSQSETLWSLCPSRYLAERKGVKSPQRCKAKAKCSQWAVGDENGWGALDCWMYQSSESRGMQSMEALEDQWLLSQLEQGRWQLGDATTKPECWPIPAPPCSQAVGGRNGDTPALWL